MIDPLLVCSIGKKPVFNSWHDGCGWWAMPMCQQGSSFEEVEVKLQVKPRYNCYFLRSRRRYTSGSKIRSQTTIHFLNVYRHCNVSCAPMFLDDARYHGIPISSRLQQRAL
ncbi:hypothetical protein AcW1_001261 [Taiwanofungus camphoratus]|nr:hypothetical protein AcV5_005473 [Antrodia cinnamomea]KAI0931301.1 hypothetical protein AcW2_000223 [Antrodia cinnamomea]KAI0931309.1 hypothetical protein AcW2_000231 [Antrodia cinnamomea]KAI0937236.1 hypothetical protein AcV5_005184 [Antrodia cinnamomea]KAI0964445.1 hypothetical protein AcW1_001261 [Antrodia cinnamomea]